MPSPSGTRFPQRSYVLDFDFIFIIAIIPIQFGLSAVTNFRTKRLELCRAQFKLTVGAVGDRSAAATCQSTSAIFRRFSCAVMVGSRNAVFLLTLSLTGILDSSDAFSPTLRSNLFRFPQVNSPCRGIPSIHTKMTVGDENIENLSDMAASFDSTVMNRYACTRFQRHDNNVTSTEDPSPSNTSVVQQAAHCLDLARRSPSGFNTQPYKMILVHSPEQKEALSKYCIGHNAHRVRDSDCTAVFLADREVVRTMGDYVSFLKSTNPKWKGQKWALLKMQVIIALFSSGYPVPRFLAVPVSFCARVGVSIISVLTRRLMLLPSLSNAETWSTKNTMLAAMAYMLGCTSRELATCPMEGFNAGGVRKALKIPRRYSVPIIIATGNPYRRPAEVPTTDTDSSDDLGMSHGSLASGSKNSTPRYPVNEVLFGDTFGNAVNDFTR